VRRYVAILCNLKIERIDREHLRFLRPALSSTCSGAIVEFIVAVTQRALTPGWAMLSPGGGIGIFGSLERIAPVSRWT